MNPKQFLQIGGIILVVVGLLGFFGVIGPTAEQSIFGAGWWFDNAENWAHLVLGVVALILVYTAQAAVQKSIVVILGVVGVLVGLYSFFIGESFLGANLENPADSVLHLVIGIWALAAGLKKQGAPVTMVTG
jgi:hypothetical protein